MAIEKYLLSDTTDKSLNTYSEVYRPTASRTTHVTHVNEASADPSGTEPDKGYETILQYYREVQKISRIMRSTLKSRHQC